MTIREINTGYNKHWATQWYIYVVSIIFDCFMPILYNFYILLATFYKIYWTNYWSSAQCQFLFFCMFFVSQKIHIKRSPNAIKIYRELFWNLCDFWEVETTQTGAHRATTHQGAPGTPWCAQVSCALLEGRLGPFLWRKKDNLWRKKSCKNFSAIGVTDLQEFKKRLLGNTVISKIS